MQTRVATLLLFLTFVLAGAVNAQPPYSGYAPAPQHSYQPGCHIASVELSSSGAIYNLANISDSGPVNGYSDFTASGEAGVMFSGQWVHLTAQYARSASGPVSMYASVWIDYDNSGDFGAAGELVASSVFASSRANLSFTPPSGVAGPRRMRIRAAIGTVPSHPYSPWTSGETEDYIVNFGFGISMDDRRRYGEVGVPVSVDIKAVGGTQPYSWQGAPGYVIAGQLPPGMSLTLQPSWAGSGAFLELSGTPAATGFYSFEVQVVDSGVPPPIVARSWFTFSVQGSGVSLPFVDDFSTDQGWMKGPTWSRAQSTGFSASAPDRSEPAVDHSPSGDNMILGDTIGGLYPTGAVVPYYAISPPINAVSGGGLRLKFARWAGSTSDINADQLRLEAGYLGSAVWWPVWGSSPSVAIYDNGWVMQEYDLSFMSGSFFQIRFSVGPIDVSQSTGWCIDDVVIESFHPLEVREGAATGAEIEDGNPVAGLRDMGKWLVGQTSGDLLIYLYNAGYTDIVFGSAPAAFAISGTNPTEFSVSPVGVFTDPLPAGQTNVLAIRFQPSSLGFKAATIEIPHNATHSGFSPFELHVSGMGVNQSIAITTQPSGTLPHVPLGSQPVVAVLDAGGAVDTTDNSTRVTASITAGPTGAILYGTRTVTAVGGYASFTDLYLDRGGAGFVLSFSNSNGGLGTVASTPFDLDPGVVPAPEVVIKEEVNACSTGQRDGRNAWLLLAGVTTLLLWRQRRSRLQAPLPHVN